MNKPMILLMLLFSLTFISAADTVYQHNQNVNYRFRCYDDAGAYCTSGTVLVMNVEYPDGSNAVDNQTLTFNQTYFNGTLPTDQVGGPYKVLVHSTTSNNTVSEFEYEVTYSGQSEGLTTFGIFIIVIILLVYAIAFFGFFGESPIVTLFGGLGLMILGITIINQGILIFRNDLTIAFASITIGLGAYFSIAAGVQMIE